MIQPGSSDYLLLPLTECETPDGEGFIAERTYKEPDRFHYRNVALCNTRTGEHHLPDENRKMLIHQIIAQEPAIPPANHWYFFL